MPGCGKPSRLRLFDSPHQTVVAELGKSILRGRPIAVLSDTSFALQPTIAFSRPASLGEPALIIKCPGANAALDRIPANDLPSFKCCLGAAFHGHVASKKIATARPGI